MTPTTELTVALQAIADELQVLRQVLDELRDEFSWAMRNAPLPPFHLTSTPADPTAPDWAARLNRFTPADLPDAAPAPKHTLFE